VNPRGPELIGDASPVPGFIPWNNYTVDVCKDCGGLVPRDWQPTHAKHHQENQDGVPTWPEDWQLQITSAVMQGWTIMQAAGPEGLAARLITMIEAWGDGEQPSALALATAEHEQAITELIERGLVEEVHLGEAEACPSLYLWHDTDDDTWTLLECKHAKGHGPKWDHASVDGGHWDDTMAVPRPWPVKQEPPAGITCLRDAGAGRANVKWLLRGNHGWCWSPNKDVIDVSGTNWDDLADLALGDLIVEIDARPARD
jgi:hypothetical protein